MVKTKVVVDQEDKLIKVNSQKAIVSGIFGTSLLYKHGQFNFHPRALEVLDNIERIIYRQDDVILTMFPKSGSTWLSECIYLVEHHYQFEQASKESIEFRFPQIDSPSHDVFELILEQYHDRSQQRYVKASIPPSLLIDKALMSEYQDKISLMRPRVISIFRNPRDVLVSFYHHCKTVKHYDIEWTFGEFFDTFVDGMMPCGPIWLMYNETLKYHKENPDTTLAIMYEDMKQDLRNQVRRICKFLNKPEPLNEDCWSALLDHLSVERMRQNQTINRHDWTQLGLKKADGFEFVRKGQVNDWKNFFSKEQSIIFDERVTDKLAPELQVIYPPQART